MASNPAFDAADRAAIEPARCEMCGAALAGAFCHACGQPSRTARRTLRDTLTGQTGRIAHTLWLLIARPGELAREIDEGRDRNSVRPLTLLLHVIAIFFLLSTLTDFRMQALEQSDKGVELRQAIDRRAAKAGVSREVYAERIERRFQSAYTVFIALSSIVYGAALWATHRGARKSWLVHAAAAIHFMCVVFLVSLAAFLVGRALGYATFGNYVEWGAMNVLAFAYLALMVRRIYAESWPRTLAKCAVVFVAGSLSDIVMFVLSLNAALLLA